MKSISEAKYISFTSDLWTSDVTKDSFISLTSHWIDAEFQQKEAVLNIKNFPGIHNAERIASCLCDILRDFEIPNEKIHLIIRDGEANIKKAT